MFMEVIIAAKKENTRLKFYAGSLQSSVKFCLTDTHGLIHVDNVSLLSMNWSARLLLQLTFLK